MSRISHSKVARMRCVLTKGGEDDGAGVCVCVAWLCSIPSRCVRLTIS